MQWYKVLVTIDNETFMDGIRGDSFENALKNAWNNWGYAEKILLEDVEIND